MKRSLTGAVVVLVGLALAMPAAGQATASTQPAASRTVAQAARAAYTPPRLAWKSCTDSELVGQRFQCATLTVPLSYDRPAGTKIHLAVTRRKHLSSAATYRGVILTNPGGPGGSGRALPLLQDYVPNGVGYRFDWIGFDPRGVGRSTPSLHCDDAYFGNDRPSYVPTTPELMSYWRTKAAGFSTSCAHAPGSSLLPRMSTITMARDMDALRQALGVSRISYYGFSWGSYLGQVYATMFPGRVGRFVLDGVVNPHRVWYGANLDQDRAFDANMNVYWHWIANRNGTFHLGTDWQSVKQKYYAELANLATHPAAGGKLGPDELTDAMLDAGYYVFNWDSDGSALSKLIRFGDGTAMYKMYADASTGAENGNGYSVYNAVQCTDNTWKPWSRTVSDSWHTYASAPFETWANTWYNAPCVSWPAAPHTREVVTGKRVHSKILLISETRDAATPYSGAVTTRALFPTASLIAGVNGTTHAGSLSGVDCVDYAVAKYLNTGVTPKRRAGSGPDLRCPPVPTPRVSYAARTAPKGMPASLREVLVSAQRQSLG